MREREGFVSVEVENGAHCESVIDFGVNCRERKEMEKKRDGMIFFVFTLLQRVFIWVFEIVMIGCFVCLHFEFPFFCFVFYFQNLPLIVGFFFITNTFPFHHSRIFDLWMQ